jgi:hypothetical protein
MYPRLKDPLVGIIHFLIGNLGPCFCGVKTVTVLHNEFTTAHEAEPWPDLIPELGLDLVEIEGQVAVGMNLPILFPATGFLPEVSRLHHGHEQFLGSSPVHFLTDNLFHLADGGQPQGQIRIDP